ncbi:hypothetical protein E3P99_01213 [Wallemia hederae]|uniref:Asparagine--tRNA ligase, mitochondrial n=1 Tax=Wallemia hederae TaxID=1540922 RepID=A0A4T0FRC0_9BASI|nr:hypothetical protein E3P99_01213 [Wallemia hederae]
MKLVPATITEALKRSVPNHPISVHGWIRSVRQQKKLSFAHLSDGNGEVQVTLSPELARGLTTGTSLRVDGLTSLHPRTQQLEVRGEQLHVYGAAPGDSYPIQKKEHGSEHLRDNAHLRTRTMQTTHMIKLRDNLTYNVLTWMRSNGFTNVQPPIITSSDCEGAGEVFEVNPPNKKEKFFGQNAYLTVSSQLHLEAVAAGFARVFTLSPTFRAEPSQTSRHLAEFWMLEAELSFVQDLEGVMSVVENCLKGAVGDLDSALKGNADALHIDKDWQRITYSHAVELLQHRHAASPFQFTPEWGASLQSEHERYLAEEVYKAPLFVTDYPASIKPFYMRANDDQDTVACFDLLVPGIGELAGGSLREERLDVLQHKMDVAGLDQETYNWYLDLRRYGTVPHGGFGVGFERLLSVISGVSNLRDIVLFPRWAGRCDF